MAKILNANIDVTLGGENASNEVISSQKAIKTYVDTGLEGKQNTLVQGANITINGSTISATDTTYEAGAGIAIVNGTIFATGSASFFPGDHIDITNGTISAVSTTSVTSGNTSLLTSGGAYTNLVRRLSDSVATGSASQGVYVDASGQVQTCNPVISSFNPSGTEPVNGTALASALSTKASVTFEDWSSSTSTSVSDLQINKLTKAQYATAVISDTELYFITDELPLENLATGTNALSILGTGSSSNGAINIGANSQASAANAIALGTNAVNTGANTFVVGFGSTYGSYTILDGTTGFIPYQRVNAVSEYHNNSQLKFWRGTQEQYNSIVTKDTETLYYITDN